MHDISSGGPKARTKAKLKARCEARRYVSLKVVVVVVVHGWSFMREPFDLKG